MVCGLWVRARVMCCVYFCALSLLYLYMHMYTLPISICVANQLNLDTTPTVVAVVSMQTNSLQWHCCCRMDFFFFSFFWTAGAASGTGAIFVCAISSHNFFFARFLASIDAYMLETTSAAYECMFLFPLRCIYKSCVVCSLGVNARKDSGMINIVVWCVLYHCTNISLWNIQFIVRLLCVLAALCMPFFTIDVRCVEHAITETGDAECISVCDRCCCCWFFLLSLLFLFFPFLIHIFRTFARFQIMRLPHIYTHTLHITC